MFNKSIILLWLGHVISHAGDAIYQIALPWLVLELTGSKSITSLIAVSAYLPAVLFSLPAGVIADRFPRKQVMIFSDTARMLLVGLMVAFLLTGGEQPFLIGTLAFAVASFASLFYPARDALIPSLVSKDRLTAANAFISTSGQFAHLAGPVMAGLLVAWVGLIHLFTIDAVTFGVSMVCIALITTSKKRHPVGNSRPSHLADLIAGLKHVTRENRTMGLLLLLTAINNIFIMGPAVLGIPIFVREVLQLEFAAYAAIEAFMAAGMLTGSFLLWRFGRGINPSLVLLVGMVTDGLTYSILYWIDSFSATKALIFLHGIGIPMITISRTTIIQLVVPDVYRGRVFSMVNLSVIGLTALSSGLVGPLAEVIPISTVFLLTGIGAALCGVFGLSHRKLLTLVQM
ncbi:MAG: MFS transporter [Candidatus Marinimicrobia bacterium]|nr:MFS transporter [Candidatus Neomarinimicrobiota bacterium]MDP6594049.1 MFS transporter [Candidatus Neomarinimicrobiota bacterium]MDP6836562.1 MFS transporter [Candidatus Neomarinimicrobiota bacterium]MDP6965801.1 MFS transporter [Candidatus Neomarinimicrobiota bacterium]